MEPLEYFEVLERLYGLDDVVRETITKVKTNKEQCKLLVSIQRLKWEVIFPGKMVFIAHLTELKTNNGGFEIQSF